MSDRTIRQVSDGNSKDVGENEEALMDYKRAYELHSTNELKKKIAALSAN